ncbi:MAG: hypothetical protein GYB68_14460 [Chloroflexi bacterium]|nr:hypothetical protein [Chloroflexota bacterium]
MNWIDDASVSNGTGVAVCVGDGVWLGIGVTDAVIVAVGWFVGLGLGKASGGFDDVGVMMARQAAKKALARLIKNARRPVRERYSSLLGCMSHHLL